MIQQSAEFVLGVLELEEQLGNSITPEKGGMRHDRTNRGGAELEFVFERNVGVCEEEFDDFHVANRSIIDIFVVGTEGETFVNNDTVVRDFIEPGEGCWRMRWEEE